MSDYQIQIKQVGDFSHCRIYRQFVQSLINDRSIRISGGTGLLTIMAQTGQCQSAPFLPWMVVCFVSLSPGAGVVQTGSRIFYRESIPAEQLQAFLDEDRFTLDTYAHVTTAAQKEVAQTIGTTPSFLVVIGIHQHVQQYDYKSSCHPE